MKTLLVKADGNVNSNKYWEAIQKGPNVECRWGRIGTNGQSKSFKFSDDRMAAEYVDKKVKEKTKEGYSILKTIEAGAAVPIDIKSVAKKEIKSDSESLKLIDELVTWNVHNITSNSSLTVTSTGVQLPSGLGLLSAEAIQEARHLLKEISSAASKKKRLADDKRRVEKYLMLCPQPVNKTGGWIDTFLTSKEAISSQESLLDSLDSAVSSVSLINNNKPTFETELSLVNGDELKRIDGLFNATRSSAHHAYRFKLGRVFAVRVGPQLAAFNSCELLNEKELWHGTSVGNLLSILKHGLIIPKVASNGRLYGDGIYLSDQTTKALNYACGYWSGNTTKTAFMFLAKAKMGKEFIPTGYGTRYSGSYKYPVHGYDSTFAKAGDSGVINNELICYNTNQVLLTHLCEFVS